MASLFCMVTLYYWTQLQVQDACLSEVLLFRSRLSTRYHSSYHRPWFDSTITKFLLFNSCHEIDCHIKLSNQLLSGVFNVLRIDYRGALDYYQAFCVCARVFLKTIYASSESLFSENSMHSHFRMVPSSGQLLLFKFDIWNF